MAELGAKLGVSYQQVQKYEDGQDGIYASTIYKMARTLNVPISYFFDRTSISKTLNVGKSNDNAMDFLLDRTGLDLVRAFNKISDRKLRRQIVEFVHAVSRRSNQRKKHKSLS